MKIETKKIKGFIKRLPKRLAENSFLTFLALFLISLIFGCLVFYKYGILIQKAKPETIEKPLKFDEKTYQNILKIWQEKEKKFKEVDFKEYPNPFQH